MYDHGRYFVVTGDHMRGTPTSIEGRQEQLEDVLARFLPKPEALQGERAAPVAVDLDDEELLDKTMAAANGAKFEQLWNGDTAGYSSRSEADLALVALLAFWWGDDPPSIDRMFRASGLYRAKWEGQDYREATIAQALGRDVYTPSPSSRPGRDAEGTRTASSSSEKGETEFASPCVGVVENEGPRPCSGRSCAASCVTGPALRWAIGCSCCRSRGARCRSTTRRSAARSP